MDREEKGTAELKLNGFDVKYEWNRIEMFWWKTAVKWIE